MEREPDEVMRWHVGDRYYGITLASTPTSVVLELDDLGPGLGRGLAALAARDNHSEELTVQFFTEVSLPITLVEQFLGEARKRLATRT